MSSANLNCELTRCSDERDLATADAEHGALGEAVVVTRAGILGSYDPEGLPGLNLGRTSHFEVSGVFEVEM
jgi:hypothetical protein